MPRLKVLMAARATFSERRRKFFSRLGKAVGLGEPAIEIDAQGRPWGIYDDPRIDRTDLAIGACILKNITQVPDFDPDDLQLRAKALQWVKGAGRGYVDPSAMDLDSVENPFQAIIDAHGVGHLMQAS